MRLDIRHLHHALCTSVVASLFFLVFIKATLYVGSDTSIQRPVGTFDDVEVVHGDIEIRLAVLASFLSDNLFTFACWRLKFAYKIIRKFFADMVVSIQIVLISDFQTLLQFWLGYPKVE